MGSPIDFIEMHQKFQTFTLLKCKITVELLRYGDEECILSDDSGANEILSAGVLLIELVSKSHLIVERCLARLVGKDVYNAMGTPDDLG